MAAKPPSFKLPPPKSKKDTSQQAAFRNYINAHPRLRQWAQGIWQNARSYGLDPLRFAQLIQFESGGDPNAKSPAGARGLGQIMPSHVGEPVPWAPGQRVTMADLDNPGFNLRWSAYYFSKAVSEHGGNYDAAYRGSGPNDRSTTYNHGYTGRSPFADTPKGYVPTTTTASPEQQASRSVETQTAKQQITDPWAVYNPKTGQVTWKTSTAPPKNVLHSAGLPVTRSQFLTAARNLNDVYFSYTGHAASFAAVAQWMRQPTSTYQLENRLSQLPGFRNSPIFKSNAPSYTSVWHTIMGENVAPDLKLVTYAIVHNLGGEGFADMVRKSKAYEGSNEFKGIVANLSAVYQQIFGMPDERGNQAIHKAAKDGWAPDQFAAYLRAQPEYHSSPEAQSKTLTLMDMLGMLTGKVPTLAQPGAPTGPPPGGQPPTGPTAPPPAQPPPGYGQPVPPAATPPLPPGPVPT